MNRRTGTLPVLFTRTGRVPVLPNDMDVKKQRALTVTIAILSCAFAIRVVTGWWWQDRLPADQRFAFGDSESYWALARAIAHGEPYEYGPGPGKVFRTPGYPLLLAPLFLIRADPPVVWARVEGAFLGTLAVGGVMWLSRLLFDETAGYIAGALSAVYPGAIGASVLVLSEAPYCPLLVAETFFWILAWRAEHWKKLGAMSILTGAIHGMATLMRPSHLLFVPFAVALAMLSPNRRRHLLIGTLIMAATCVTLAPWWWRNYQVTGRFVATTLQFGASLYDGWNPNATGASDMRFVDEFVAAQKREDAAGAPRADSFEQRLDRKLKQAAIDWARDNPIQVLRLAFVKFLRMWSPLPNASELQSWTFRLAIFGSFTPLICGAVLSSIWFAPRGWPLAMCWLPVIYLTSLHIIFVSSIRYREPAMLPLIALAAGGITQWTSRLTATRRGARGGPS
jgi:4-amino-4-deoxy-L-arabinose transferase-like glycosyltransferase